MTKLAKLLLTLLIISGVLNIVFLISIVNLKSSITRESIEEKTSIKNYGYTPTYQPKEVSRIDKMIKDQRPTFKMLNAMPTDYVGKKLILYGYAEIRTYYNYGYRYATTSHYSVRLKDSDYENIGIYFPKSENEKLFELLGQAGSDGIPLRVEAIELESRYESHQTQYLAEGQSWQVLK
jgi:hypothetical protein